jgi:hypothetical protein
MRIARAYSDWFMARLAVRHARRRGKASAGAQVGGEEEEEGEAEEEGLRAKSEDKRLLRVSVLKGMVDEKYMGLKVLILEDGGGGAVQRDG